jgi:hypothetical protein
METAMADSALVCRHGGLRRKCELCDLAEDLGSAVNCLQEIAAMSRKMGSETAANWLQQHGYPREPGGYVAGKGFSDSATVSTGGDVDG